MVPNVFIVPSAMAFFLLVGYRLWIISNEKFWEPLKKVLPKFKLKVYVWFGRK